MQINYRLEEPILHLLWGLVDVFFGYNFPKLRTYLDEIWNISEGHGADSHKKMGEIASGMQSPASCGQIPWIPTTSL